MGQPLPSTTPEYKKKVLLHNNIDPSQFDLTDDGDVVPRNVQQPSIDVSSDPVPSSSIEVKPQQSSSMGAFGRGALASTAPTLGGLGAAGLASIALAPETGGLSLLGLLGVGAAGLGGSMATGKVQDALLPDSAKQQLAIDQQEHPVASTVGGLAPSALMFNPVKGVMNLPAVAKAGYTGVTRGFKSLEQPAEQLLKNTAVNVGMNVGSGLAAQGINGQPIDGGSLGVDALSGLLFNEPTSIGKAILPYLGHAQPKEQVAPVAKPQQHFPAGIEVKPSVDPRAYGGRNAPLNDKGQDFSKGIKTDAMHNYREEFVPQDLLDRMDAEGYVNPREIPSKAETDAHKAELARQTAEQAEHSASEQPRVDRLTYEPQDLVSKRLNEQSMFPDIKEVDRARQLKEQQDALRDSQDEVLQEQIRQAKLQKEELQRQNDLKEQENLNAAKASAPSLVSGIDVGSADFNKRQQVNQDIQTIRVKPENPKLAIMRPASESKLSKYQDESSREVTPAVKTQDDKIFTGKDHGEAWRASGSAPNVKRGFVMKDGKFLNLTEVARRVMRNETTGQETVTLTPDAQVKFQNESVNPDDNDPYLLRNTTPQYKKAVMELAAKRGITLREAKGLVNPATGKEVLGKVNLETRVADINPNRAELDTPVHEVNHGYVDDLLNSADPHDRALAKRGIDIFGGDMQHAEEALTTRIGVDGAERIKDSLDGSALKQFSSWFKDFTSRMKVNLGVANDEDVVRHLGARLQHDAPYGTRKELGARYTGFQPGFGAIEGRKLYTTKDEVKDKEGNVKIGKNSTVGSSKLEEHGVKFQDELSRDHNFMEEVRRKEQDRIYAELDKYKLENPTHRGIIDYLDAPQHIKNLYDRNELLNKQRGIERQKGLPQGSLYGSDKESPKFQSESSNIKDNPNFKNQEESASKNKVNLGSLPDENSSVAKHFAEQGFTGEHRIDATKNWRKDTALMRDLKEAGYSTDVSMNDMQTVITKKGKTVDPDTLPSHLIEPAKAWLKRNGEYYGLDEETVAKLKEEKESAVIHELTKMGVDGREAADAMHDWSLVRDYVKQKDPKFNQWVEKNLFEGMDFDNKYQEKPSDKLRERKPISIPLAKPEIQKIRENFGESGKVVADSLDNFYESFRHFKGEFTNDIVGKLRSHLNLLNPKELATQNNATFDKVLKYMDDVSDGITPDVSLSPKEKEIEGIVRDAFLKMVEAKNSRPGLPDTIASEDYFGHVVSRKTLNILFNKSGSSEAKALIDDFFAYQKSLGHDETTAKENLEIFRKGYQSDDKNLASSFGPIDKAAGVGIPQSWREQNLIDRMARFANRYARRIAYHDSIETNKPAIEALTNSRNGIGDADVVKGVMDDVAGKREHEEAKRNAVSGVIRAAMLGPLTGAKDFVSNLTLGLQHQTPLQAITSPFKAWSDMRNNLAGSFKEGINRHNFASLEFGDGGIEDFTNILRSTRDVLNEVQGRNILERLTRATAFGQGKFLAMDNLLAASKERISGQGAKFLNDFADKGIDWKQYRAKGEFPPEVLNKIAARYVESVQGTYDYRGLPAVAQKGSLAPVLSLARWNIEKMNNFVKYNVEPARQGNFTPLLMSTIGMLIGGAAVEKLVEEATGKKSRTPTIAEIKAGKNKFGPTAYKLAALSSMSGYAGIMGDITKSLLDKQYGNKPQGYTNPLVEGVTEGIDLMSDVSEAVKNGDVDILPDVLSKVLETYFQSYRLGLNQLSPDKKKDTEKSNKFRDLRVFKQLNNIPQAGGTSDAPNPFLDLDAKEFKETHDPKEAAKLLPGLITKALKKADGNVEVLKNELQKLKANSYQTMPSPDRMPITFMKFLETLRKTQGDEAASARLIDYMRNNASNKAKSGMVPSF